MKKKYEMSNPKKIMRTRLINLLKAQGRYVQNDELASNMDKLEQAEMLINLTKFLDDYEENIEVLNKYWIEKRRREKFEQAIGKDIDD